jgi:6-phosphofructokinase 1
LVDLHSEHYRVAREYMIRLEPEDLADDRQCARLAEAAGMNLEEFRAEYSRTWAPEGVTP